MNYLLDTHALVWWLYRPHLLSVQVLDVLEHPESEVSVSAISAYEIGNKYRVGKWPEVKFLSKNFTKIISDTGFKHLMIGSEVATVAANLQSAHRDPFDRIVAAHSIHQSQIVLTKDPEISKLGATVFW